MRYRFPLPRESTRLIFTLDPVDRNAVALFDTEGVTNYSQFDETNRRTAPFAHCSFSVSENVLKMSIRTFEAVLLLFN